jgi:hypothetical protein
MSEAIHAQECESVIALSKVVATVVADKDSVEQHAANFCNEYSRSGGKSSSASYGASYKFLSASYGSTSASVESVASSYCSASNSYSASKDAYKQYIETISPNAYSAYEQCLRMSRQDLKFNVNTASILPNQFSMSASFVSSTGQPNAQITYSASKDVTCHWDSTDEKTRILKTGHSAILECEREDSIQRSYVSVIRSDVGANQDTLTLPWQRYDKNGDPVDTLEALRRRIISLETQLAQLSAGAEKESSIVEALGKRGRILAMISVHDGNIVSKSNDVSFDRKTGTVSFPNPDKLPFVPVICHFKRQHYITQTHFIREIEGTNKFTVWQTALDTGDRNAAPSNFTAVVVGF